MKTVICVKCKYYTKKKYCVKGRPEAWECSFFEAGKYAGKKYWNKEQKNYEDNPVIKALRAEQANFKIDNII